MEPHEPSGVQKISEIESIESSRNEIIKTREEIGRFVEKPLLKACEILYDKNIQTMSTSANLNNIKYGGGHILINFDTLSDENKEIGKSLGEVVYSEADKFSGLNIDIPITEQSTAEEVETFAIEIVSKFKKQEMTWAPRFTLAEMRKFYAVDESENVTVEDFSNTPFYYDRESCLFFMSEEHAQKAKEKLKNKDKK